MCSEINPSIQKNDILQILPESLFEHLIQHPEQYDSFGTIVSQCFIFIEYHEKQFFVGAEIQIFS